MIMAQRDLTPNELPQKLSLLKSAYPQELSYLTSLFDSWSEADILSILDETSGDIDLAISRISEGHASQWKTKKSKSKAIESTIIVQTPIVFENSKTRGGISQRGARGSSRGSRVKTAQSTRPQIQPAAQNEWSDWPETTPDPEPKPVDPKVIVKPNTPIPHLSDSHAQSSTESYVHKPNRSKSSWAQLLKRPEETEIKVEPKKEIKITIEKASTHPPAKTLEIVKEFRKPVDPAPPIIPSPENIYISEPLRQSPSPKPFNSPNELIIQHAPPGLKQQHKNTPTRPLKQESAVVMPTTNNAGNVGMRFGSLAVSQKTDTDHDNSNLQDSSVSNPIEPPMTQTTGYGLNSLNDYSHVYGHEHQTKPLGFYQDSDPAPATYAPNSSIPRFGVEAPASSQVNNSAPHLQNTPAQPLNNSPLNPQQQGYPLPYAAYYPYYPVHPNAYQNSVYGQHYVNKNVYTNYANGQAAVPATQNPAASNLAPKAANMSVHTNYGYAQTNNLPFSGYEEGNSLNLSTDYKNSGNQMGYGPAQTGSYQTFGLANAPAPSAPAKPSTANSYQVNPPTHSQSYPVSGAPNSQTYQANGPSNASRQPAQRYEKYSSNTPPTGPQATATPGVNTTINPNIAYYQQMANIHGQQQYGYPQMMHQGYQGGAFYGAGRGGQGQYWSEN